MNEAVNLAWFCVGLLSLMGAMLLVSAVLFLMAFQFHRIIHYGERWLARWQKREAACKCPYVNGKRYVDFLRFCPLHTPTDGELT